MESRGSNEYDGGALSSRAQLRKAASGRKKAAVSIMGRREVGEEGQNNSKIRVGSNRAQQSALHATQAATIAAHRPPDYPQLHAGAGNGAAKADPPTWWPPHNFIHPPNPKNVAI